MRVCLCEVVMVGCGGWRWVYSRGVHGRDLCGWRQAYRQLVNTAAAWSSNRRVPCKPQLIAVWTECLLSVNHRNCVNHKATARSSHQLPRLLNYWGRSVMCIIISDYSLWLSALISSLTFTLISRFSVVATYSCANGCWFSSADVLLLLSVDRKAVGGIRWFKLSLFKGRVAQELQKALYLRNMLHLHHASKRYMYCVLLLLQVICDPRIACSLGVFCLPEVISCDFSGTLKLQYTEAVYSD